MLGQDRTSCWGPTLYMYMVGCHLIQDVGISCRVLRVPSSTVVGDVPSLAVPRDENILQRWPGPMAQHVGTVYGEGVIGPMQETLGLGSSAVHGQLTAMPDVNVCAEPFSVIWVVFYLAWFQNWTAMGCFPPPRLRLAQV